MIQRSNITALLPQQTGMRSRANRTKPQQAILAMALIVGVVIVLCLYLMQASKITTQNYDMKALRHNYATLTRSNSNMLALFAYERSVHKMNLRADKAGFSATYSQVQRATFLPMPDDDGPMAQTTASTRTVPQVSLRQDER